MYPMARPGLLAEEVAAAAEKIIDTGFKPTIQRVREELGNHGSTTTISRYLKTWRASRNKKNNADNSTQITSTSKIEKNNSTLVNPSQSKPTLFTYPENKVKRSGDRVCSSEKESTQYAVESLQGMTKEQLEIKILQLESLLMKEKSRRESAEGMARDLRDYAEILKEEVGRRMEGMEQSFEGTINELHTEVRQLRMNASADLKFYRDVLAKANAKVSELLGKDNDHSSKLVKK